MIVCAKIPLGKKGNVHVRVMPEHLANGYGRHVTAGCWRPRWMILLMENAGPQRHQAISGYG